VTMPNENDFARRRPNVIIIYPDQMRYDAMGCAGNPCIRTPNIDRLAREGVGFSNAHTSFPLCSPFRASLMTGKYAHSHGLCANHYPIKLGQRFLAEIFRDHGYKTGYVGKWHMEGGQKPGYVPPDRRLGFDWFVGFNRGHSYFAPIFYRNDDPRPRTSRRYEPDFQTDHLIEFMQSCLDDPGRPPFLAMIAYGLPHIPLIMPDHYKDMYSPQQVPVRLNTPKAGELSPDPREFLARYYGLVTCVDDNVGRILNWLDENNLSDDTLVCFISDHGDQAGEHGLFDKKIYYEASMHVPLIFRWPAGRFPVAGGRGVDGLVDASVDVMPTLLELCRLPVPQEVQGRSLVPLLQGEDTVRQAAFYEICKETGGPERFPVPQRGVRTDGWLYVRTEAEAVAMFDLEKDPLEMNNIVNAPSYAEKQNELDRMVRDFMRETSDGWGIEAVFPPPGFITHQEAAVFTRQLLAEAIAEP